MVYGYPGNRQGRDVVTLSEKYRPATLQEVVGQDKAVRTLKRVLKNGAGGRAISLSGPSGTGKNTIAYIVAANTVSNGFDTVEVVARELTTASLRDISRRWMFAGGHALIVNEIHGLSRPVIELFLQKLEHLPPNVVVIFTTTRDGLDLFEEKIDAVPFASRCLCISLTSRGLALGNAKTKEPGAFALRAYEIANKENLNGRGIGEYVKLINDCKGNLRTALSRIEAGEMLDN